jgi:hypothetical protein
MDPAHYRTVALPPQALTAKNYMHTVCIQDRCIHVCQSAATWTKQQHLRYALIGWQLEAVLIL